MAVKEHRASLRFACTLLRISRNSIRPAIRRDRRVEALRRWMRLFARRHPRWGWRKCYYHLRLKGISLNKKKVRRLWREEGLVVRRKSKQRRENKQYERIQATSRNHIWALDFQFDQTSDGRVLKCLNIIDEYTRESLAGVIARNLNSQDVSIILTQLIVSRGAPTFLRCDNGKEFTAKGLVALLASQGVIHSPITPASPWQNGKCESYNGILRDELLNQEVFETLEQAQFALDEWRNLYNHFRPHGSLQGLPPAVFAERVA